MVVNIVVEVGRDVGDVRCSGHGGVYHMQHWADFTEKEKKRPSKTSTG